MQAESINGLKNVYGLQLALHLPEGSEIRRQTLVILKMKPDGRQLLNYSQVPNNRPHPPLIVNSSIFFPPRTSLFQPSPLPLPLFLIVSHFCTHFECKWPFPPYSIKKKKNFVV